ncbi:acyl-CoA dehydrogenase family protein [Gordonia hydrophobica]|uniref:Acyl-CoA dehydrogenase family protein n=1 Tax=Gordonia hydrophobica TaxID=40516 RepID=A0ABZ2U290_9ACTN|nr:acyl-CoA dehydrogenase family protein [Gordonia hydrophobica]MBM7368919.1 SfnB family sulfur acquisition oxidoreductase [Gordonia hydrophobica]
MTSVLDTSVSDPAAGIGTLTDPAASALRDLLPVIAASASDRDRDRTLPRAEVDALSEAGLLAVTVPVEYGGRGLGIGSAVELTAALATVDPSLAQIPQSHFVFLDALRRGGSSELAAEVFGRVLGGERLANAQTERGGATVLDDATVLVDHSDGLRLTGRKYYCTGSVLADWLAVRAGGPTGRVLVYVQATTPGVTIDDDWDAVGQRTTASGTVAFDEVVVDPHRIVDFDALFARPSTYGARAQILHAAIDVGIAVGASTVGAEFAHHARPWFEADVERGVDDPLLISAAGELELTVRGARALLDVAVAAIESAEAAGEPADLVAEASLATAAAKVAGGRAARRAGEVLFDLGGTRAAAAPSNLSRYWRDARTHSLHDPERWKLTHLGRWALTRTPPPIHGNI